MPKLSAGIVLYRRRERKLEVFLVHPGGPFWKNKDAGAWSIPKGEFDDETPLEAAKREFEEETGLPAPGGPYAELSTVQTKGGKAIHAFAVEADFAAANIKSNEFE